MNYIAIRPGLRAHKYVYTFVICLSILSQRLFVAGQPLRSPQTEPACIRTCIAKNIDCQSCVKELAERLSTPKHMDLPYYKAHDGVPDPVVGVRHHHFLDRPPWVPGSSNTHHQPGDGKTIAEGKVHTNCPAMRARSRAPGITLRMPYTVRFHRAGVIEVDCHWISEAYVHSLTVGHPVDSPWIRLPQSHMQIFTVGDSRADVWIVNSGIYINDESFMSSPNADPADKGGSQGNKWMVLPIPHKLPAATWHVEQGIFSSFLRTGRNANIPIQLNFTALDHDADFIEIAKGTPMIQYVPVVLPAVEVHEEPMPTDTVDYLVLLSKLHDGGDIRETKEHDLGAYDTMKSYQLKDNPGYVQHSARKARGKNKPSADEL
eukprot:m.284787 g.284787  ORF g.284787 m.284787 type:complete len:375 (+) comp19914_c0_seq2:379-1503(+)